MQTLYNQDNFPVTGATLFLAGPTPRAAHVKSWRPEALEILKDLNFNGNVIIPEDRGFQNSTDFDYAGQIDWEHRGLERADIVVFWVPRVLADMPAFTTNVEFGLVYGRGQPYVLGFPLEAPKMRYLEWMARHQDQPVFHTLCETLQTAIARITG